MTYTLRNLVGIARVYAGRSAPEALLFTHSHWPRWLRTVYVTCIGYHLAHALEFAVTALCYLTCVAPHCVFLYLLGVCGVEATLALGRACVPSLAGRNASLAFLCVGSWRGCFC